MSAYQRRAGPCACGGRPVAVQDREGVCQRCLDLEKWLYGEFGLTRMLGLHQHEHSLTERAPAAAEWVDQPANESLLIR